MLAHDEVAEVLRQIGAIHKAYRKPVPTPDVLNMLVDDIAPFGLAVVLRAFSRLRVTYTGQQPITSALLIAACESAAGRLSPDEAWSLALAARDEAATVVWNDEIEQAWWGAAELMRGARPDLVGARRAFIETYTRVCHRKRERGELPVVRASLGTDKRLQVEAVRQAKARGLDVAPLLTGEQGAAIALALEAGERKQLLLGQDLSMEAEDQARGEAARKRIGAELGHLQAAFDQAQLGATPGEARTWEGLARNLQAVREGLEELARKRQPSARPALSRPELLGQLRAAMAAAPAEREARRERQLQDERDDLDKRKRAAAQACAQYQEGGLRAA